MRLDRPAKAYDRGLPRIPGEVHRSVLGESDPAISGGAADPYQLASQRNYRRLMPVAWTRKPMLDSEPAMAPGLDQSPRADLLPGVRTPRWSGYGGGEYPTPVAS